MMRSSPGWFLGLGEAPVMMRDGDTSATKFSNGTSSPPWPSGAGEVQNMGVLAFLSLMWGVIGFGIRRDGAARARGGARVCFTNP
jgi:hypothetical protein